MKLNPHILEYIDIAVSKVREENKQIRTDTESKYDQYLKKIKEENKLIYAETQKDYERYMGALKEGFVDQVKLISELLTSKPDEQRVREIVHEETVQLRTDVSLMKVEIGSINREPRRSE